MKNLLITLGIVASLSQITVAENIDGTLAVDAGNALTNTVSSAENSVQSSVQNGLDSANNQLSANLNNNSYADSAKDSIQADTAPVSTGYIDSGYAGTGSYLEGPFIGVEGSAIFASEAEGESGSGMSLGLRFGAQNIEWRTMAILEKFGSDEEYNNYVKATLQLDYYFLGQDNLMVDTFAIRPYAGVNAGGMSVDTKNQNVKTLTYGGQVGATMNLTRQIDLDVGYRYNLTTSDLVDHTSGVAVGLHFKY